MRSKNYHNNYNLIIAIILLTITNINAQDSSIVVSDSSHKIVFSSLSEFKKELDDIFNDQSFRNANWGVSIQSLKSGETLYKRNDEKFFIPASNLKLFTTAAGLLLLGPNYKFSTSIWTNGYYSGSTLYGDLVIQGRGDPTISGRFYNNDLNYVFDNWIDSLTELGIDKIKGNIIGDDNLFDEQGFGEGWSWDYLTDWYAAQSSALSFNDNCVDLRIYYDKNIDSIVVKPNPDLNNLVILNNLVPASTGEQTKFDVYRERGTNVINVFGKIKISSDTLVTYSTVRNPTQFTILAFKKRLEDRGVRVNGYAIDIDDYDRKLDYKNMKLMFTSYSNDLSEIIKVINKNSQNFFAEQLLKTIGLEIKGYGSTEKGIEAIKDLFKEIGLNPDNIVMVDGSGLSYLNMVTPRQIVDLLKYMYSNKDIYPYFYNSLPIAGVDGSLGKRMKNTTAEGIVRAKTGYIGHVRSLSGYAVTGDNEPIAFSMIANNFNVPVKLAENLQDLVCLRMTNFRRK